MKSFVQCFSMRTVWLKVHLWLALSVGLFFVLVGLTGSISVYKEELDELLNPQLVIEHPQGEWQSLDKIMVAVRAAHPKRYGSWTLEMPRTPNSMLTAWYDKPRETFFELYAPLMVSVNPYTAQVVESRLWGKTLTTWVLDAHTQLLMNRFGWNSVGVIGILLCISVTTGLYLWWPGYKNIMLALKITHRKGLIRLLFDVHKVTGLLIAPIVIMLAITGFMLSYPVFLEKWVGSSGMAHGETGRNIISTAVPHQHPTGLESAEFVARGSFFRATLRRVTTPVGNNGVYRINLRQMGEINQRHPFTTVWVDRWSGQIKDVRDPHLFTAGETFQSWVWPLHTGEAVGGAGRLIWCLTGLGLLFLYVSGFLRWLHRRGKIRDHIVDLSALRAWLRRVVQQCIEILIYVLHIIATVIRWILPHIKAGYVDVRQEFYRLYDEWRNQQKRIDKD